MVASFQLRVVLLGLTVAAPVTATGCASRSVIGEQNGAGGAAGNFDQASGRGGGAGGAGGSGDVGRGGTGGGGPVDAAVDGPPASCTPACGAHATCVSTGGGAACACVAGYVASGGACLFGTVVQDPGFQDIPAGAWTLEQGATLDSAAAGYLEPGELEMNTSAICTSSGVARQTVTIPSVADSEPLALKVTSTSDCTAQYGPCVGPGTSVLLNGGALLFTSGFLSDVSLSCLGERAYGGTFDLVVRPADRSICGTAKSVDAFVDHLDIEPSVTCPMPGTLPDGDFDDAVDNWTTFTSPDQSLGPPAVAEILAGAGTSGTRAGHLSVGNPCDYAWLTGPISPPLSSIPNLAVKLRYQGTVGDSLRLTLNGVTLANLPSTVADWTTGSACLPEGTKGMTEALQIALAPPLLGDEAPCSPETTEFVFDDLQFVSDPTCPATAWIVDGDFERPDAATTLDTGTVNASVTGGAAFAGIDETAANAHGGTHSLELSNNDQCDYALASFPISIPLSDPGAGPALTFYYRAPTLASSGVTVTPDMATAVTAVSLDATATYARFQLCLDPILSGQTTVFEIKLASLQGACGQTYPAESVWFDDFTMGTSTACPTN